MLVKLSASNGPWSCFLAQASLFLLLVSFSSGFFAAIPPWKPDSVFCITTPTLSQQLIGSNTFSKEITQIHFNNAHLLIEMHSRWLPHEAGWENSKSVQSCHQGKGWLLRTISNIKYILICLTLFWVLHDSICVISLEWVRMSKLLSGSVCTF